MGVNFDSQLIFDKHFAEKAAKANRIIRLIATFVHLDIIPFRYLFSALVRPHFEYATPVWSPHQQKHYHVGECSTSCNKKVRGVQAPQL